MVEEERGDQDPAAEVQSAHPTEPAEGAREPGEDARKQRPPHPVESAEGSREKVADQSER